MKKITILLLTFCLFFHSNAQEKYNYGSPLDIPLSLSGNFGELRANHFHSGIDFRTQGVINKNVYSIDDGYIARIGVNAGGYGLVLYINHPNGHTSVYAHLDSFSSKINNFVKEEQYKREQYAIDINNISPNLLPVKKGDLIAKSGNTGSSGGPHVHFEIRDTQSQFTLDPLPYYSDRIEDKESPEIRGIAIYPQEGIGVVNRSLKPYREKIKKLKNGEHTPLSKKIEAWGVIGLGIHAIDRMSKTSFIYGIKKIELLCDNNLIFSSNIESLDFSTSRMMNSFVDFDYWRQNKRFYIKSFIEPGNTLNLIDKSKTGYININEERTYSFCYKLEDVYGNITTYIFLVEGKKQDMPKQEPCSLVMQWDKNNRYISGDFQLHIQPNALYRDINFILTRKTDSLYFSKTYKVHNKHEPLDKSVQMSIQLKYDTIENKQQYGIISIDNKGKEHWIGGNYNNGFITAKIRELGQRFAISIDSITPEIDPIAEANWTKDKKIVIKLKDDFSGIQSFNATINGKFALFEHDIKSPNYVYYFDEERLAKGTHILEFKAVDRVGNETIYKTSFLY